MKIVSILGARPQFIKAAPVTRALTRAAIQEVIVHTGQHYDEKMSQVFFADLEIPSPAYRLDIGSASHGAQTGRMLEAVERVLLEEKPNCVLVYGDTNSTIAGALAAVKLHMPIAHVEAGLRSHDRQMPEEINRVVTDHIADLLLAPTLSAVKNLLREGIPERRIGLTGDVMYDAALHYGPLAEVRKDLLTTLGLREKEFILATLHRAENTDDPVRLMTIMMALEEISACIPVVMPLHPRTGKALAELHVARSGRVSMIEPVGYVEMMVLEKAARLIATDSGGVQKEAFFQRTPCVTLRDTTEWTELLEAGWNRLAPPISTFAIVKSVREALETEPGPQADLYGDGHAADRIVNALLHFTGNLPLTAEPSTLPPQNEPCSIC